MHSFATLSTIALSLVASVSSVAIPRATQPEGWATALLEPYNTYHTRYMALSCETQHKTDFFTQCCHPLLATESLASRPAECDPANDDDLPFCDDDGDDDDSTTTAAPTTTTTHVPVTTTKPAPTTTTKAKTTTSKTHTTAAAAATKPPSTNSASTVETGGVATFFFQNGVAGACGKVHSDSDLIAAIDAARYGDTGEVSSLCGKQVKITNTNNQKTVTVTIEDACPTCNNANSIDLSEGAFERIATIEEGEVPITWEFL